MDASDHLAFFAAEMFPLRYIESKCMLLLQLVSVSNYLCHLSPLRFTISLGVLQGDIFILSGLHVLVGTACVGGKTIYFLWWNLELRRLGRPNSVLLFPLLH